MNVTVHFNDGKPPVTFHGYRYSPRVEYHESFVSITEADGSHARTTYPAHRIERIEEQ